MEIKDFTDLDTWQKSQLVVLSVYKLTKQFPDDEKFGLVSQLRRAAISITSNIAEGYGRRSHADKKHFYVMAQASLYEVQSQMITAKQLGYINNVANVFDEIIHARRLLSALIKSIEERK